MFGEGSILLRCYNIHEQFYNVICSKNTLTGMSEAEYPEKK